MTGTLAFVFVGVAVLCVIAGVDRRLPHPAARREADEEYGEDDGEATYAEEAAAVAAAEAAAAAAQATDDDRGRRRAAGMIGTIIIIVVVVAVLAIAAGAVAATRSRRRPGRARRRRRRPPRRRRPRRHRRHRRPTRRRAAGSAAPPAPGPSRSRPRRRAAPPSYRSRLGSVRGLFSGAVSALRSGRIDAATWESLEEALIRADVGVSHDGRAARRAAGQGADQGDQRRRRPARGARARPSASCSRPPGRAALRFDGTAGHPDVWLFVGVNGVGKTTTIGKLARRQSAAGHSVLLAAGDTFRAAAADQLAMWAERTGTEIVRGAEGGDPSAIVFDAVQRAAARGNDLVLADTAGRLHTKVNLVEELKKIRRIADRDPGNVTEVLLVLDATTGQNALTQARQFTEAVDVTGIVLTKLDGTAKGGIVIAVRARARPARQAGRPRRGARRPRRLRSRRVRRRPARRPTEGPRGRVERR